jgi:hypothetical protein
VLPGDEKATGEPGDAAKGGPQGTGS